MEDDLSNFHHEDDALDRELNSLVREMEHEEAVRRAVIEMLVMLGSDGRLTVIPLRSSARPAYFPSLSTS